MQKFLMPLSHPVVEEVERRPKYGPRQDLRWLHWRQALISTAIGDMFKWPYESPKRGANTCRFHGEFDVACGGWEIDGELYTHTPGSRFDWFWSGMLWGQTNHRGRTSLRFGPKDFKHWGIDGLGEDWTIFYEEIKPYYDKADKLVGILGTKEGLENEPDGSFMPPPKPRLHELLLKKGCDKIRIPAYNSRMSIITRPLNEKPPCHSGHQRKEGGRYLLLYYELR